MRILMVQTYHYHRGGDSTLMFNLARLLEEHGHEVIHFAMQHPENLASRWSPYFTSEIDYPKMLAEFSLKSAVSVVTKSVHNREAASAIARLADDTRPDLAHFHSVHGHLTTSIIGPLRKRKIPIVWTLHDYRLVCPNTLFLRHEEICERCLPGKYYHAVLGRCKKGSLAASAIAAFSSYWDRVSRVKDRVDRFLSPSDFLKRKLIAGRIAAEKITVVPNFVDVRTFQPGREQDYFLYFGRLAWEKGVDLLVRAVAELPGSPGRLKIVGDGPAREALQRQAAEAAAPVDFLGFRTGDELRELLAGAQFVVVPSRWYENLPFSVIEALAMAKPVLATAVGGIPELVEDGVNGILFAMGDIEDLKRGIVRLLADPDLRRRMAAAARERAERLFDRERHYELTMRIYNEVLQGKTSG